MRNILQVMGLVLLLFLFDGCSRKKIDIVYIPELNKTATAEVGQNMYEKFYAKVVTRKIVNLSGKQYKFGKVDDVECATVNRDDSLLDYNCDGYFTHKRGSFINRGKDKNKLEEPIKYEVVEKREYYPAGRDSFKYNVLYQGKVDSKIKIAYQEFYLDKATNLFMIRPAFEQIIDYELEKDGTAVIGFKGLRIEVLKATNLDITYKVLKDYD